MPSRWPGSLLIVGCGNMGGAMLDGWLSGGLDPASVTVVDPFRQEVPPGVTLLREVPLGSFDAVLLGIKPQQLSEAAPAIVSAAGAGTTVLSILAGVAVARLDALFPEADGRVRIMPNLAAAIGKSPIALAASDISPERREAVSSFMAPLGTPEWVDEVQFDAITALVGSGPAFVYRYIDALADAAAQLGLEREQAGRLALAMVEGASLLAAGADVAPGELAERVASPGGTTRAGLDVLDANSALAALVAATLRAASERSAEMARETNG